jgi:hypothetical protein
MAAEPTDRPGVEVSGEAVGIVMMGVEGLADQGHS